MGALFYKKSSNKIKYLFQVEMIYSRTILAALHVPVMTRFAYSRVHVLKIATPGFDISYCNLAILYFSYTFYPYIKNAFIERSEGWSLRSGRVLDQSQQECHFFLLIFKSAANFSAPAQEGNLFFLSGRSA